MPPLLCCCPAPCILHTDNFNRADASPPSGRWSVVGGVWELDTNRLRSLSTGPIVTTVRQPPSTRINSDYSIKIYFKALSIGIGSSFGVICGYEDENNFAWVRFSRVGDSVFPEFFVRSGGSDTLVMDITTHPGGIGFPIDTGGGLNTWTGKICYSLHDWTVDAGISEESGTGNLTVGSEHPWTVGTQGGQAALPSIGGMVGFLYGEFDDFAFHQHWEAKIECDHCSCLCINPTDSDDYRALPEVMLATFVPQFDPLDYPCSLNYATVAIYQVEIEGETDLSPVKKVWTNQGIEDGTGMPGDTDLILRCNDSAGTSEQRFTLGLIAGSGTGTYRWGDTPLSSGDYPIAYVRWAESTCSPLSLVFGPLSADPTTCETVEGGGGEMGYKIPLCVGSATDGCRAPADLTTFNELAALEWKVVITEP